MESRSYACPRCGKGVKSTSGLTRHVNACKIPITLPSRQPSTLAPILEYNTTNYPDLPLDNFEKDNSLGASNNGEERIRPADIDNDEEDIRPADLDEQRPATPNWRPRNGLLSESSSTFREVTFSESEFPAGIPVSDTQYEHPGSQNNNPFCPFNDQLDYALAHYFAESETTKRNIDRFLTNPLMKPITEKLSYRNADEWMEKLSDIPWGIPDDKWTEHKFELESGLEKIAGQNLTIQSRNVIDCLRFFMGHPGFRENQTYQPSRIYNQNNDRVYNEMYTDNLWWEKQKELPAGATIIPILLASDKTVMSLSHRDRVLWPVYVTIDNLDAKTCRSQNRPGTLLLSSIPIVHKRAEDSNNKDRDLKAKTYHLALRTMLERM
jgi:Plavaka transposase